MIFKLIFSFCFLYSEIFSGTWGDHLRYLCSKNYKVFLTPDKIKQGGYGNVLLDFEGGVETFFLEEYNNGFVEDALKSNSLESIVLHLCVSQVSENESKNPISWDINPRLKFLVSENDCFLVDLRANVHDGSLWIKMFLSCKAKKLFKEKLSVEIKPPTFEFFLQEAIKALSELFVLALNEEFDSNESLQDSLKG